jgi:uncharacterized protein YcaQ
MAQLTWTQVARWRAAQHFLDKRAPGKQMLEVVSKICGVQAQVMSAAELALWARVQGITPDVVQDALWKKRTLVKTWAMRGTLHLLAAEDLPLYVAAMRTRKTNFHMPAFQKYHGVKAGEAEAIMETIPQVLAGRTLTREQLAQEVAALTQKPHLQEVLLGGWGSLLKPAAAQGTLCFGPSEGQNVTFVHPADWLGEWKEMDSDEALQTILRGYIAVFAPATPDDFVRWWSGINPGPVKKLFKSLGDEIEEVEVEGEKGWVLAEDAPQMAAKPKGTMVKLLPNFDTYVIAALHHRRHLLPDEKFMPRVYRTAGGWISPVVLVNGMMAGVWEYEQKRSTVTVTVELFEDVGDEVKNGIEGESKHLSALLGGDLALVYK